MADLRYIAGHKDLYFKSLVLHRDISVGNIMICPSGKDVSATTGHLIDLDHAKVAETRIPHTKLIISEETQGDFLKRNTARVLGLQLDKPLTEALLRRFYEFDSLRVLSYFHDMVVSEEPGRKDIQAKILQHVSTQPAKVTLNISDLRDLDPTL